MISVPWPDLDCVGDDALPGSWLSRSSATISLLTIVCGAAICCPRVARARDPRRGTRPPPRKCDGPSVCPGARARARVLCDQVFFARTRFFCGLTKRRVSERGEWFVKEGLEVDAFSRSKMDATAAELKEELALANAALRREKRREQRRILSG